MERIQINGTKYLLSTGTAGSFINEPCFGLNVGDKVKQIGKRCLTSKNKSGITSSNRVDIFNAPVEYCGVTFQPCGEEENAKALAFKLNNSEVKGIQDDQSLYVLYFINEDELLLPDLKEQSVRIYKPYFILASSKDRKITKKEWQSVLSKMVFNKQETGYVDFMPTDKGHVLEFWNADPKIENVSALFVTKKDVQYFIKSY